MEAPQVLDLLEQQLCLKGTLTCIQRPLRRMEGTTTSTRFAWSRRPLSTFRRRPLCLSTAKVQSQEQTRKKAKPVVEHAPGAMMPE